MVGIPVTESPTRTYVVVVHDIVSENEAHFVKIELPISFKNTSRDALYYYQSINKDRATRVLACIPYEEYLTTITGIFDEVMLEKPTVKSQMHTFSPNPTSLGNDMREVRHMLDAWNDEQESPNTTYAMILRSILYELKRKTEILDQVKGVIKFVDDQEAHKDQNE